MVWGQRGLGRGRESTDAQGDQSWVVERRASVVRVESQVGVESEQAVSVQARAASARGRRGGFRRGEGVGSATHSTGRISRESTVGMGMREETASVFGPTSLGSRSTEP